MGTYWKGVDTCKTDDRQNPYILSLDLHALYIHLPLSEGAICGDNGVPFQW